MKEEGAFNNRGEKIDQESVSQREDLSLLRSSAETLVAEAHSNIEDMYRTEEQNPLERRDYHNVKHTEGVEDKAEKILRTMREADSSIGITERDIILARLFASHHDIDQSQKDPRMISEVVDGNKFQKELRARYTETIEKNSSGILRGRMQEVNKKIGKEVFTERDMDIAHETIMATIPGFARGTVIQPYLKEDASLITYAVALADLGAMMDGGEEFLRDGNRVFREDNIDIEKDIEASEKLTPEKKEFIYQRIKEWYKSQIGFVEGRQVEFENQMLLFPGSGTSKANTMSKVRELFDFPKAIEATHERLNTLLGREKKGDKPSFEEMMNDMGYDLSKNKTPQA